MTYTSAYSLGPGATPPSIRRLIAATCVFSIITALLNPLFLDFFQIQGPNYLFSLSWYGLKSGYLWQPLTYLLVEDGIQGLSFALLITLFFQMYVVWIMGTPLVERVGGYSFALFYFFSGIATGIVTILAAPAFGQYPFLMGPTASIIAIWVVWTMMHPDSELLFFFVVPIKAKWLLAGVFGALLLVNLSQGNITGLIFDLTAGVIGYAYGVIAYGMEGPFSWMLWVDHFLMHLKTKLTKKTSVFTQADDSKVIDIHTGKPFLDDEAFVDAMLDKISKKGEYALTWSERRRMRKISEKKHLDQ